MNEIPNPKYKLGEAVIVIADCLIKNKEIPFQWIIEAAYYEDGYWKYELHSKFLGMEMRNVNEDKIIKIL